MSHISQGNAASDNGEINLKGHVARSRSLGRQDGENKAPALLQLKRRAASINVFQFPVSQSVDSTSAEDSEAVNAQEDNDSKPTVPS
jgi:hypothetical protein